MQSRMNVRNMAFAASVELVPKKGPKGAYVMIGETANHQQQRTIALSCQDPSSRFGAQIN